MTLLNNYKPLFETDKRYILITGGRGSAKSFHASVFASLLTYEAGHRILFSRYTMTSAKISIVPEFEEKIDLMNAEGQFSVESSEIANQLTGSQILFRGIKTSSGNQTASLKSLQGITTWILDEAEELVDEDIFDKIDLSIRSVKKQNRVILILNPSTKEHWIWQRWFEGHTKYTEIDGVQVPISTHPDICHIHTTYQDNKGNLPEDYLNRLKDLQTSNPDKYRHVVLGGWMERAEGVVYDNWKEGEFDTSLPYGYGMDFGYSVDPTAVVKIAVDNDKKIIYLQEILYERGLSYTQIIDRIKDVGSNDLIMADCADPRMIDEIHRVGHNIQPCVKGADSVKMGISKVKDYQLIVTEDSHNVKKELNNYVFNDRKAGIPVDKYNHALDALRYIADRLTETSDFYIG